MDLRRIKSLEFWAREYRLPLFWLTDPRHLSIGTDNLFLFKPPILHCYYLNGRMAQERIKGSRYFLRPDSFSRYVQAAQKMERLIKQTVAHYGQLDLDELSDRELLKVYDELTKVLGAFSALYTKTEAERLKRYEGVKDKDIRQDLQAVGKMRFRLRQAVEALFHVFLGPVLKQIVNRHKVKAADLFFYDHRELRRLMSGGSRIKADMVARRRKGYALLNLRGKGELLVGDDYHQVQQLIRRLTAADRQELKGLAAYPGKVQGRVVLLLHDVRNLEQRVRRFAPGSILVTEMTTPATILACKKASAIVTDEGGVLCHAAIISRELKKPCVVGTKHATQVLKTGDLVEVDAEQGIIRKIQPD